MKKRTCWQTKEKWPVVWYTYCIQLQEVTFMMGKQSGQIQMVILDIDSMIPDNHLLRQIKKDLLTNFLFPDPILYIVLWNDISKLVNSVFTPLLPVSLDLMPLPIKGILQLLFEGLFSVSYSVYVPSLKLKMSLRTISALAAWLSDNRCFPLSCYCGKKMGNRHWHWSWLCPDLWHMRKNTDIFHIIYRAGLSNAPEWYHFPVGSQDSSHLR